ncbi:MAG: hypothetical protein EZS28_037364 [Streblomastix strix]|uniref:C2 domain-containing protein n=1 Tax=Streblomastix strix TaxID=222440 RepID=A0A5J4UA89_9EUKA|nr:MAG: hypothetical protein EZS28_037364 [Streblomastix strix]
MSWPSKRTEYAGDVYVTVVQLFNVKKVGLFGQSDPYVTLGLQHSSAQTSVVKNNANPVYNETYVFKYDPAIDDNEIRFRVYDQATFGSDTSIGTARFSV